VEPDRPKTKRVTGLLGRFLYFKYKHIKKCRNKAIKFHNNAKTIEEKKAWSEVIKWYDSFLAPERRILNGNGAIGTDLPFSKVDEILSYNELKNDVFRDEW